MRFSVLIILFAVAFCAEEKIVKKEDNSEFVDTLRCILDHLMPLKDTMIALLDAIEQEDQELIVAYVLELAGAGGQIYLECIKKDQKLLMGINWKNFGECILQELKNPLEVVVPEVREIIEAIKNKDWLEVAAKAIPLLAKGVDVIVQCAKSAK